MITFKQFLQEKAMNKSVYADVAKKLSSDALIGFEVEFLMPSGHDLQTEVQPKERSSERVGDFQSLGMFEMYFDIARATKQDIQNEYEQWVTDQEDDWVEENWERFLDDDEVEEQGMRTAEKNARRSAQAEFDGSKLKFRNWMTAQYGSPADFIAHFSLTPKYGSMMDHDGAFSDDAWIYTEPKTEGEGGTWTATADQLAAELGERINDSVQVREAPGGSSEHWKIVPDTSITDGVEDSDQMTGLGFEIVSPPMLFDDFVDALEKTLSMIDDLELVTNTSTGIHVSMSVPGIKEKLDPLKLVLFAGDEHVLKIFDRTKNNYAIPQIRHIVDGIQVHGKVPSSGQELVDLARKSLSQGKFVSVNVSKLAQGYIEFRAMGGENYHREVEKIKETAGRFLTALDLACDPDAERKEYMKKVAKLLGRTHDVMVKDNNDKTFDEVARKVDPENWGRIKNAEKAADVMRNVLKFAGEFATKLGSYKPNVKQISELRAEFKRLGITAEKLRLHQQLNADRGTGPSAQAIDKFITMMKVS